MTNAAISRVICVGELQSQLVNPRTYTKPLKFASNNEPKIAIVGIIIGDNNVKNLI